MIEVNNLTTNEVNEALIKKIIKGVLSKENINTDSNISVAFIGPGRMVKLNKVYRGKNRVTDVLSFSGSKVGFGKFKIGPTEKMQGLGEIVICLREVTKNARKQSSDFDTELKKIVIHGVLHLLGYDHEKSETEAKKMERKEESYF